MSISQGRSGTLIGARASRSASRRWRPRPACSTLLGAKPLHGRLLRPDEDTPGQPPVVILSHGFWQRAVRRRSEHRRQDDHAERPRRGHAATRKNQFEVAGVLGPDFLLNDEIMPTVASIRQMDVFLPLPFGADAVNAARRRELQRHGAPEAGRDDGAGARATSPPSPAGFARRTSATGPSRSTSCRWSSPSSATSGWRCWCCWDR